AEPIQGLTSGELLIPPPTSVDPQQRPEVLAPEHPDEPHAQAYGPQGELMIPPPNSVDTQQSPEVLAPEHPDEPHAPAYGAQTVPSREQSPLRVARPSRTATQGLGPSRLVGASGTAHRGSASPRGVAVASDTATQGSYSPRGMGLDSGSGQNLGDAYSDPVRVSPNRGDAEEYFIIPANEVGILRQEYSEFITLKDNAEVVLAEAIKATERLNTVFSRVRASMNRMSPRIKELIIVPVSQASGKTLEPGNNRVHDRAAAKAATQRIIDQTAMMEPAPVSGADERARTTRSRIPGDRYSRSTLSRNIPEDIPPTARGEQQDYSQPTHGREAHTVYARDTPEHRVSDPSRAHIARDIRVTKRVRVSATEATRLRPEATSLSASRVNQERPGAIERSRRSILEPQSIDMNALREEIKSTISAIFKEKLRSDAESVTTVSQSMPALDTNAQYWSDLSTKAARRSRRALELQLKLAEEKVNTLLSNQAPERMLREAASEAHTIRLQLDQNSRLREAGLMPEQQELWGKSHNSTAYTSV
ncbi:hypothetical protein M422DRAFT_277165, partial [Sphaerobolus stellatus SS14]